MNYMNKIWPNFEKYVTTFPPLTTYADKLTAYFGNGDGTKPPTAFRNRELAWYNPISDRFRFNCGYRLCINVYQNCDHSCAYCYVNSYCSGVATGKPRAGFQKRLRRDLEDFRLSALPPAPVHISNSTDPLQERLEIEYRDTMETLNLLAGNGDLFSEVIILTKNPALLLEGGKEYIQALEILRDKVIVEISVAFYRDNFKQYEPCAPHPHKRLEALKSLIAMGYTVRLRLDPLFPRSSGIQTDADLDAILDAVAGVQCVISKPLRLVKPKSGGCPAANGFFDEMWRHYQGGIKNGVEWHGGRYVYSKDRAMLETAGLMAACRNRNLPLVHCKDTVMLDESGRPALAKKACPDLTSAV